LIEGLDIMNKKPPILPEVFLLETHLIIRRRKILIDRGAKYGWIEANID